MAKFELEPGEQVVHRVTHLPLWLPALMTVTGLLLTLPAAYQLAVGSGDFISETASGVVGVFMLVLGVHMFGTSMKWTTLVTDRRLLQRQGRMEYHETPLAEVDEVRPYRLGDGLFLTAHARKFVIPCKEKTAARIRDAIECVKGAA